jgi:hypothetical protein
MFQEALHKKIAFCVRVMSVGCYQDWSKARTQNNNTIFVCAAPPEDEQVVLETCRGH